MGTEKSFNKERSNSRETIRLKPSHSLVKFIIISSFCSFLSVSVLFSDSPPPYPVARLLEAGQPVLAGRRVLRQVHGVGDVGRGVLQQRQVHQRPLQAVHLQHVELQATRSGKHVIRFEEEEKPQRGRCKRFFVKLLEASRFHSSRDTIETP